MYILVDRVSLQIIDISETDINNANPDYVIVEQDDIPSDVNKDDLVAYRKKDGTIRVRVLSDMEKQIRDRSRQQLNLYKQLEQLNRNLSDMLNKDLTTYVSYMITFFITMDNLYGSLRNNNVSITLEEFRLKIFDYIINNKKSTVLTYFQSKIQDTNLFNQLKHQLEILDVIAHRLIPIYQLVLQILELKKNG